MYWWGMRPQQTKLFNVRVLLAPASLCKRESGASPNEARTHFWAGRVVRLPLAGLYITRNFSPTEVDPVPSCFSNSTNNILKNNFESITETEWQSAPSL